MIDSQMLRSILRFCLSFLALSITLSSFGAPVSPEKAQTVASNWLRISQKPLGAFFPGTIERTQCFGTNRNTNDFYVITLTPTGYVIVSADDEIEPIIAFSATETFPDQTGSPLLNFLRGDIQDRLRALTESHSRSSIPSENTLLAKKKWSRLLSDVTRAAPSEGVNDIRVLPLVESKWGQRTITNSDTPCYNFYTPMPGPAWEAGQPENYLCGCVATAMAQLMRFHEYPTQDIGTGAHAIWVDGTEVERTLRGGDGSGSAYDWTKMPLEPTKETSEENRKMIGALCYDAGLAVGMKYTEEESSATMGATVTALKNTFRYANAIRGYHSSEELSYHNLESMINPNLDLGIPVLLGIRKVDGSGHAIVCDGYGYNSLTLYHHLNMGWQGADDLWYNLPNTTTTYHNFSRVTDCAYNILKDKSGVEIASGRVLSDNGLPEKNIEVVAYVDNVEVSRDTTDERGIFAVLIPSGKSFTLKTSGYNDVQNSVGTSTDSVDVGNVWGIEIGGLKMNFSEVKRLSVSSTGTQGDGASIMPSLSDNGLRMAFHSEARNLVNGDTTGGFGKNDVFVYDTAQKTCEIVSKSSTGVYANDNSWDAEISGDARYVVFSSKATNLVDGVDNGMYQIYRYDREKSSIECLSTGSTGEGTLDSSYPDISEDGSVTVFASLAPNLTNDGNGFSDIYIYDHATTTLSQILASNNAQPNETSAHPVVSRDGRYVAFESFASNFVQNDTNGKYDIFVYDRKEKTIERISVDDSGTQGNGNSFNPSISTYGRYVAFESDATNLVTGDSNGRRDIFVYDRTEKKTRRVSQTANGTEADNNSYHAAISGDGSLVAFDSLAKNLVSGTLNGSSNIYLVNWEKKDVYCVTNTYLGSAQSWADSRRPALTKGGGGVAFDSNATNLVENDTNGVKDVFIASSYPPVEINIVANPSGAGQFSPCGGTFNVPYDCSFEITATPFDGYNFVKWQAFSDVIEDTSSATTMIKNITSTTQVTAYFEKKTIVLTFIAGANGTLEGEASQSVTYGENSQAVTAVPDIGYHFVSWSTGATDNPLTLSNVKSEQTVTAEFAEGTDYHSLIFKDSSGGNLSGDTFQSIPDRGNSTPVLAIPEAGYYFYFWIDENGEKYRHNPIAFESVIDKRILKPMFSQLPPQDFQIALNGDGDGTSSGYGVVWNTGQNYGFLSGMFRNGAVIGETELQTNLYKTAFLSKYDSTGSISWARRLGGENDWLEAKHIATNSAGNVILAGSFSTSITLDAFQLNASDRAYSTYIAIFGSDGTCLNAIQLSGDSTQYASSLAIGPDQSIYIAGYGDGIVSFGSGIQLGESGSDYHDFVAKYDENLQCQWARTIPAGETCGSYQIAVNETGAYFLYGSLKGAATINGATIEATREQCMLLCKYTADGTCEWHVKLDGAGAVKEKGLTLDLEGNPVVTDEYKGDFTLGEKSLSSDRITAFVAKLDGNDGTLKWLSGCVNQASSSWSSSAAVCVNSDGSITAAGEYIGEIKAGEFILTQLGASSAKDAFVLKLDANGNVIALSQGGGSGDDMANAVCAGANGSSWVTGYFTPTGYFGDVTLEASVDQAYVFLCNYGLNTSNAILSLRTGGSGAGTTTPNAGEYNIPSNYGIELIATPGEKCAFTVWTVEGDGYVLDAFDASTYALITGPCAITAMFEKEENAVVLRIACDPAEGGSVSPTANSNYSMGIGAAQTISASPAEGYSFLRWELGQGNAIIDDASASETTIRLKTNSLVTAVFTTDIEGNEDIDLINLSLSSEWNTSAPEPTSGKGMLQLKLPKSFAYDQLPNGVSLQVDSFEFAFEKLESKKGKGATYLGNVSNEDESYKVVINDKGDYGWLKLTIKKASLASSINPANGVSVTLVLNGTYYTKTVIPSTTVTWDCKQGKDQQVASLKAKYTRKQNEEDGTLTLNASGMLQGAIGDESVFADNTPFFMLNKTKWEMKRGDDDAWRNNEKRDIHIFKSKDIAMNMKLDFSARKWQFKTKQTCDTLDLSVNADIPVILGLVDDNDDEQDLVDTNIGEQVTHKMNLSYKAIQNSDE